MTSLHNQFGFGPKLLQWCFVASLHSQFGFSQVLYMAKKVSWYDKEMPQLHTTDQPMARQGRVKRTITAI